MMADYQGTENIVSEEKPTNAMEYLKEKSVFCFIHRKKEVSLFCRSCDKLVCATCIIDGDHSNHKFCEMDDVVTRKQQELGERVEQTNEEMIRKVQHTIRTITMQKENVLENCKIVSDEIDNRKMELSQMLEAWSQNQQSLITAQQGKRLKRLDEYLVNSETCLAILEQFQRNPKCFENIDGIKLVHVLEMLQNATGAPTNYVSEVSQGGNAVTFTTEIRNADKMGKLFGHVTGIVPEDSPRRTTTTKFKFCDSQIDQISPIGAKKAFVVTANKLYLVDSTQVNYTVADNVPLMTNVKYITPVTERGIYVQQTDTYVIHRVTVEGQTHHFADFKYDQYYPSQTIRISHAGKVLLVKEFKDQTSKKYMLFHEYNNNGIKFKTSQNIRCHYTEQFTYSVHTASSVFILTTPKELPQKRYQPGCVVDVETATKYVGTIGPEPADAFHPRGLCKDEDDCLIVGDYWNHAIHQLTCDGKFKKFLMTEDDDLKYPTAVGVDNINWLWVAQNDGHIHVVKYVP